MYTTYLNLLSQLLSQNEVLINLFDKKISVAIDFQKNCWMLSSKIFNPPNYLIECLLPGQRFKWGSSWIYLVQREEGVYLKGVVSPLKRYIQYKAYMEDFIQSLELFSEKIPKQHPFFLNTQLANL